MPLNVLSRLTKAGSTAPSKRASSVTTSIVRLHTYIQHTFTRQSYTRQHITMPSGDYSAVGGGALKLKGAKIQKKKKKRDKSDLEKSLSATEGAVVKKDSPAATEKQADESDANEDRPEDQVPSAHKTESERKYDEIRKKRVSIMVSPTPKSRNPWKC